MATGITVHCISQTARNSVSLYQHWIWIGQYVVARIWSWVTFCEFYCRCQCHKDELIISVWLSECNEYLKWAVFVLSQLTSTNPVNKSSQFRFQMMCVNCQPKLFWVKCFGLLSAYHSNSLCNGLFQPVPVLLWSIPSPTDSQRLEHCWWSFIFFILFFMTQWQVCFFLGFPLLLSSICNALLSTFFLLLFLWGKVLWGM